ncbi:hypothetical protein [Microbacterium sp. SS28]|uniref:hypothetical protein n=1 Tax=Microbacterium sp. SS28 TaxID=2919948 RepID=UPI001FAA8232|nr:hypothetical protein [Microbacterium sp. SS28]
MSALPDRVIAFGVECRRTGDDTWSYVSVAPWPQLAPDGTPMISILAAGDLAFVQLSAQLDPPGAALEQARAVLAGDADPASVTLSTGVSAVTAVEVAVTTGDETRIVATSKGSGYAPFAAVFSLQATAEDREAFEAALSGETDRVAITYDVVTARGPARISADLADWARID